MTTIFKLDSQPPVSFISYFETSSMSEVPRKASRTLNDFCHFSPNQEYFTIKANCLAKKILFEDEEFPANPDILSRQTEKKSSIVINYLGKKHVRKAEIKWMRPKVKIASM